MNVGTLNVKLTADFTDFDHGVNEAEKSIADLKDSLESIRNTAAVVAGALGALGAVCVDLASDLADTRGAMDAVFGEESAREIQQWAKATADSVGRSTKFMEESATAMQAMLAPMLGSKDAAAAMSKNMAQLSVDLAAMFNAADADALLALRSGLSGESEPLKRFGIVMNEAGLSAFALSRGLKVAYKDMDEASKVAVRHAFIMEQTKLSQGAAAKEADQYANQMKRLQGQFTDLGVQIGNVFLPAATETLQVINDLVRRVRALDDETIKQIATWGAWAAGISAAIAAATGIVLLLPKLSAAFAALTTALTATKAAILTTFLPLAVGIGGAILLVGALRMAWEENLGGIQQHVESLREGVGKAFEWIANSAGKAWEWLGKALDKVLDHARNAFLTLTGTMIDGLKLMLRAAAAVAKIPGHITQGALDDLTNIQSALEGGALGRGAGIVGEYVAAGFEVGKEIAKTSAEGIVKAAKLGGETFTKPLEELMSRFSRALQSDATAGAGPAFSAADLSGVRAAPDSGESGKKRSDEDFLNSRLEEVSRSVRAMQQSFASATDFGGPLAAVRGFEDFNHAVDVYSRSAVSQAIELSKAAELRKKGDFAGARAATEAAEAHEALAQSASVAVEAFTVWRRKASPAGMMDAIQSALGGVGRAVESAMQGFAAGGLMGAVIAATTELLMQSQGFANVLAELNGVFQILADLVGAIVQPLAPLISALGLVVAALADSLAPLFDSFAIVLEPITVLLVFLAEVLAGFAPVIRAMLEAFMLIQGVISMLQNPLSLFVWVLAQFVSVLGKVASIVIGIVRRIAEVWNGAVNVVQSILNAFISAISFIIPDSLVKRLRGLVGGLDALEVNTEAMRDAENRLANITYESALAKAKEKEETEKAAKAMSSLTESLLNAPQGFRVALARFRATDPDNAAWAGGIAGIDLRGIRKFAEGGRVTKPTLALIGEAGEAETVVPDSKAAAFAAAVGGGRTIVANFYGVTSAREIWTELKRLMEEDQVAQTGGLVPAGPRWLGR